MSVLPQLTAAGVLPPGVHAATWQELLDHFGSTPHRQGLLDGLRRACVNLRDAGVRVVWLGGSLITDASEPRDFDGVWDHTRADLSKVDPVLIDLDDLRNGRLRQKAKYGGELLIGTEGKSGMAFQLYFQQTPDGERKGIVRLDLRTLP